MPTVRIAALIESCHALRALGQEVEAAQAARAAFEEASGSEYARLLAQVQQLG